MIFVGDIAHPFSEAPDWSRRELPWGEQPAIVNLEGPITAAPERFNGRQVTNHPSILAALKRFETRVTTLANNHITDVPSAISSTRAELSAHGIQDVGVGESLADAVVPARMDTENGGVVVLAFGWEAIHCRAPSKKQFGVAPLRPRFVLESVRKVRRLHAEGLLVVVFHWNYELEPHPQPAHRQLAFRAVEAGADAVIGHHPHCVGGFESYRGAPIAYSLGNWWLPHGCYFDGKLEYPPIAFKQLAFEWCPPQEPIVHWFEYQRENHDLIYQTSEPVSNSTGLRRLTPYAGFGHGEYCRWYRKNRLRRRLLPIYRDYRSDAQNFAKDVYLRVRHASGRFVRRFVGTHP